MRPSSSPLAIPPGYVQRACRWCGRLFLALDRGHRSAGYCSFRCAEVAPRRREVGER